MTGRQCGSFSWSSTIDFQASGLVRRHELFELSAPTVSGSSPCPRAARSVRSSSSAREHNRLAPLVAVDELETIWSLAAAALPSPRESRLRRLSALATDQLSLRPRP